MKNSYGFPSEIGISYRLGMAIPLRVDSLPTKIKGHRPGARPVVVPVVVPVDTTTTSLVYMQDGR